MKPQQIKKAIDRKFNTDISQRKRTSEYVFYRDLYFDLAMMYCYPEYSLEKIGKAIERNHATVLHCMNKGVRYPKHNEYMKYFISLFGEPVKKNPIKSKDYEIYLLEQEIKNLQNTDFIKENEDLKFEVLDLKYTNKQLTNNLPEYERQLLELPKELQKTLRSRFSLIVEMETKKIYSYIEKRQKSLKTV